MIYELCKRINLMSLAAVLSVPAWLLLFKALGYV